MIAVHKSVVHPWQCDVMGHMTTRFYVAMFDDASYHLLHTVFGWQGARDQDANFGWADVRHVIDYVAEVKAGDLLDIQASISKIGNKSLTVRYEMTNTGSGEIAATLESVSVLFDLKERKAAVLTDELRQLATKYLAPSGEAA